MQFVCQGQMKTSSPNNNGYDRLIQNLHRMKFKCPINLVGHGSELSFHIELNMDLSTRNSGSSEDKKGPVHIERYSEARFVFKRHSCYLTNWKSHLQTN